MLRILETGTLIRPNLMTQNFLNSATEESFLKFESTYYVSGLSILSSVYHIMISIYQLNLKGKTLQLAQTLTWTEGTD